MGETEIPAVRRPPVAQAAALYYDPIGVSLRWTRRYGPMFTLTLPATGPLVMVSEPQAAHRLLTSDPGSTHTGAATGRVLELLGSGCVLRLDGAAHRERRRVLNPLFRGASLTGRRASIEAVAATELERWPTGRPLSALTAGQRIAFAVIADVVLGLTDPTRVQELHDAVRRLSTPSALAGTWLSPVSAGGMQSAMWRHWLGRRAVVDRLLERVWTEGGSDGWDQPTADELVALLLVGHETTATALAWALERLAHRPDLFERLADTGRTGDDSYLQAFIREVLRWRPPVVDAVRELVEPTTILGRTVPAGTLVMISTVAIHHDATRYPDPGTFRPERFLIDRPVEPGSWIPFGGGHRHCLGSELAVLELSVVLTQLVRTMTVQPVNRRPESSRLQGTMIVPARGGRVRVSRNG